MTDVSARDLLDQRRSLRAIASALLGDVDEADDVVQDAYVVALEHGERKPSWLRATVRNLARRRRRDSRQRRELLKRTATLPETGDITVIELSRDIANAVLELPEGSRTAVIMRFWHGLPPREIAERLGEPLATIKSRLQRGLRQLRRELDRRHGREAWAGPLAGFAGVGRTTLSISTVAAIPLLLMNANKLLVAGIGAAVVGAVALLIVSSTPSTDGQPTPPVEPVAPVSAKLDPAEAEPAPTVEAPARDPVEEPDGPTTVIHGRVVDAVSGRPIEGARIRLFNVFVATGVSEPRVVSDSSGRFAFDTLELRNGWLWWSWYDARADGLAPQVVEFDHDQREAMKTGELDLGDIALERGVEVTGRIFDAGGEPLDEPARLVIWDLLNPGSFAAMFQARTVGFSDVDGTFVLPDRLAPARREHYHLGAVSPRGVAWTRFAVVAGQTELDSQRLTLMPNGGLAVEVVNPDGEPVENAWVRVMPHFLPIGLAPMWQARWGGFVPRNDEFRALFERRSDRAGRAEFHPLPLGEGQSIKDANRLQKTGRGYIVAVQADGFRPAHAEQTPERDGLPVIRVELIRKTEPAIHGIVRADDGTPAASVLVRGNGYDVSSTTDEHGAYRLPPFEYGGGAVPVILEGDGYLRTFASIELPADATEVEHDLVIDRQAIVTGRVVDQDGLPIEGVEVLIGPKGKSHHPADALTDATGAFVCSHAPPGELEAWLTPPEPHSAWRRPWTRTVRGGAKDVVLTLHRHTGPLVRLEIDIVDGDGRPLAASEAELQPITVSRWDPSRSRVDVSRELGKLRAKSVTPGRYRLKVLDGDRGRADEIFEIDGSEPVVRRRVVVGAYATVFGDADLTAIPPADLDRIGSFLMLLRPGDEDAFAVDVEGKPLRMTPNTEHIRPGTKTTYRLERVTPNKDLSLVIIGNNSLWIDGRFRLGSGEQRRVDLRPVLAQRVVFTPSSELPRGWTEVEIERDGTWFPEGSARTGGDGDPNVVLAQPPGPLRWRLTHTPDGGGEPIARDGTAEIGKKLTTIRW